MNRDEASLNAALEIMAEMKQPHLGGDCQLQAKIQVIVNTALDRIALAYEWQPIETALKDGTKVIILWRDANRLSIDTAFWDAMSGGGEWIGYFGNTGYLKETEAIMWTNPPVTEVEHA